MTSEAANGRWRIAQEAEKRYRQKYGYSRQILEQSKRNWEALLDLLPEGCVVDHQSKRILEVGGAGTSVFLAVKGRMNVAVDPLYEFLFELYPVLGDVDEYRDVVFVSRPIEDLEINEEFDLIFAVNTLDHMGNLDKVSRRIDSLLACGGYFIILVDCHFDSLVRSLNRRFDADLAHPHHFIMEDIEELFSGYSLVYSDSSAWKLFRGSSSGVYGSLVKAFQSFLDAVAFGTEEAGTRSPRFPRIVPLLIRRLVVILLSFLIGLLRHREEPVYPLKKPRLFVFRKQTEPVG
jgi:SAM-dependent methyltransferase